MIFLNILYKEVIVGSNLYNNTNFFFDRISSSLFVRFCLTKKIVRSNPKTTMDFSLTGLKQLPQHNRCCHNTNCMALKHKNIQYQIMFMHLIYTVMIGTTIHSFS